MSAASLPPPPRPHGRQAGDLLIRLALGAVIVAFGAPFLWVVAAAFDAGSGSYVPWPSQPTLDHFSSLFRELGFGRAMRNSVAVAGGAALLAALAAALAGYSLSRLRWRGAAALAVGILLLQTMPLAATMVPIYDIARRLDLRNSYLGLILIHSVLVLPFLVWLMKGFFDAIPVSLEEAAWVDGASRWQAWRQVLLPIARTGLAVALGLSFMAAWAEVLLMLVLIDDMPGEGKETVALAFYRAATSTGGLSETRLELVAAMAVLYVVPVLALFLASGRLAVEGLTGSAHGQ
jgi:multiple sugar transport system permease protein